MQSQSVGDPHTVGRFDAAGRVITAPLYGLIELGLASRTSSGAINRDRKLAVATVKMMASRYRRNILRTGAWC
jgi:hypothetical protein